MPAPTVAVQVDPVRHLADGILYCDVYMSRWDILDAVIARGLLWRTAFSVGGRVLHGSVIAASWKKADEIADARGLGEVVVGKVEP